VIGAHIVVWFGWRAVFVFIALFALTLMTLFTRAFAESLPAERRRSLHLVGLARNARTILLNATYRANFLIAFGFFMSIYVFYHPALIETHAGDS
jgi:DHA1 family bicyclomycin/chloramphenicol resistance-like MFS transporter